MTCAALARTAVTVLGVWFCAFLHCPSRAEHASFDLKPATGKGAGFSPVPSIDSGIGFTNRLDGDAYLTNAVAHNGAGLAIGDVDGDGRPDIYFCGLEGGNALYRNAGNWRFEKMEIGPAECAEQFSTGAVLADVDGDNDLDLLVNGIASGTRLFLNEGQGRWREMIDSGLSRTNTATSMALADIDGDGDLDIYSAHYIDVMHLADPTTRFAMGRRDGKWEVTRVNGESTRSPRWKDRFEALPDGSVRELPEAHALYRNEGKGRFKAIQNEPGVFLNEQGQPVPPPRDWGLAVMFRDFNADHAPDMYVCNDNASPDRFWINTGNGTFRAAGPSVLRHTSRSSMGIDVADINRDGYDDFIVVDMLARDHGKRMTQLAKDYPSRETIDSAGAQPRFNRNMLFLGREDGTFAEAALMAGVAATDWSWCPIFLDVDLDGYEDLLVSNGFSFDVMDQDSHDELRKRKLSEPERKRQRQLHPSWPTKLAAFRNLGNGRFEPHGEQWGFDQARISYGMAVGDLDGDGDLDLVVNNLNEGASLYRNESTAPRVAVQLKGLNGNTEAIGARVQLKSANLIQAQEIISGGRYMAGDQAIRVFATAGATPMSLEVTWRNGSLTVVSNLFPNRLYAIQQTGSELQRTIRKPLVDPYFGDASSLLKHKHHEAPHDDWARQPLLPRRLSRMGPGVSWFDMDSDGWEDLIIGTGRGGRLAVFQNKKGAAFQEIDGPLAAGDQNAVLGWVDALGNRKLLVTQSNLESPNHNESTLITLSLNGAITNESTLSLGKMNPGPVCSDDIDGDGDLDVFVGGRSVPGRYPESARSILLINNGTTLVYNESINQVFENAGMVSGATFVDLDADGDADLALALEWGPIRLFQNSSGRFDDVTEERGLATATGWWTSVSAGDFDGDGKLDLAAGNWGRNSAFELGSPEAWQLRFGDLDRDGSVEVIEAWLKNGQWHPVRNRSWLARSVPELQQRFSTHAMFGAATLADLTSNSPQLNALEARQLESSVFLNRGNHFERVSLPQVAQLSPIFSLNVGDLDGDGIEDLVASQNFFGDATDLSREDCGRGLWLHGIGDGTFREMNAGESGIKVLGEQRGAALADFNRDGRVDLAVSQNSGETKLYVNARAKQGLRVKLNGPKGNPDGVGTTLRVRYSDGSHGPTRAVQAGSAYMSQDGATQLIGLRPAAESLFLRWPGGKEQVVRINGKSDIVVQFQE